MRGFSDCRCFKAVAVAAAFAIVAAVAAPLPVFAEDVLFFGNSFTSSNNIPQMVQEISASKNKPLTTTRVTKGGQGFSYHLLKPATDEALKSKPWAWIILQDHSLGATTAAGNRGDFITNGQKFYERIVAESPTASIVLYETWALSAKHASFKSAVALAPGNPVTTPSAATPSKPGDAKADMEDEEDPSGAKKGSVKTVLFADPAEMYGQIHAKYGELQVILQAKDPRRKVVIAPVGTAFAKCVKEHPEIDLYGKDLKHPSFEGSYLSALVIYATITGDSPVGAVVTKKVNPDRARVLQQLAADITNTHGTPARAVR